MNHLPKAEAKSAFSPLGDWGKALGTVAMGGDQLVAELKKTKADYSEAFAAANLPTYTRYITSLESFLHEDAVRAEGMDTPTLWFQLIPKVSGAEKITRLDVADIDVKRQVKDLLAEKQLTASDYDILVSEFLTNKYGGQVTIDPDGGVQIYFGEGAEADYTTGEKPPQYMANNAGTGVFHYSFSDPKLRTAVQRVVKAAELPGYYEFAICGDALQPIFLDYRPDNLDVYRPQNPAQL